MYTIVFIILLHICLTIIFPVVLCGCETRSLKLMEEWGAEDNIWAQEGQGNRGMEKST